MTISSQTRKAGPFVGNDSTTAFPFAFKVFTAADLYVVLTDTTLGTDTVLVLTTDYTVSLNANQDANPGGTVTLLSALATGYKLTITSSLQYLQPTDLTNNGGFYPKVITNALDRLTIFVQQLYEQVTRSLKVSVSTPAGVQTTLPAPAANKLIGWNETADNLQNMDPTTLATIVAFGTTNADKYNGDGTTTQFALSANPGALNNLDVSVGGVTQRPGLDYTWAAGTTITFMTAPPSGTNNVLVRYMQGLPQGQTAADLVTYTPAGAGASPNTVQAKLRESTNAVSDFGADNTGAVNATAALLNFFNFCISTGTRGHIPAGDYLVSAGALAFDNGFTKKLWPDITTDGFGAVRFLRADATNAPMISITNGTASSGVARTWLGGSLGGITFDQNGKSTGASQHGLLLRGIVGTKFGYMRANNNGGSCIHIEQKLYGGSNPDPYNISSCYFEAAEANRCGGAAFYNDNFVGFAGNTINYVRAIENQNGAFFGFGAGNRVNVMSVGSCAGWALGNPTAGTGGTASRFSLGNAELDDVQYGIDIRRVSASDFGTVRFVHRYNFGPLNPAGGYWPRIAVQAGTVASVSMLNLNIIDRIEAGGAKVNMGQLFDFGSAGGLLVDVVVRRQILDNAGFGFVVGDYYTNFNANSRVTYTDIYGHPIIDGRTKTTGVARAATTFAVPSGGFTGAGNTVQYGTQLADAAEAYNPATWTYTCRSPGQYRIAASIVLAVAVGTRIRLAIMVNGSATTARYYYATTANAQAYEIDAVLHLLAGAQITINADQNSGVAVNLTTLISSNDNLFTVSQV